MPRAAELLALIDRASAIVCRGIIGECPWSSVKSNCRLRRVTVRVSRRQAARQPSTYIF
jgi:hypothetical protein